MKSTKKDNMTDAVEAIQRNENDLEPKEGNQQVTDKDDEIVTLGQNNSKPVQASNKRKVIELSPEIINAIDKAVHDALERSLEKFASKNSDKFKNNHE